MILHPDFQFIYISLFFKLAKKKQFKIFKLFRILQHVEDHDSGFNELGYLPIAGLTYIVGFLSIVSLN